MQTVVRDPALLFARAEVRLERRADGSLILNSAQPLGRYPATLSEHLLRWAGETPERDFILERTASGAWSGVTYPDGAGCGGGRA
jgi:feruloyl-CoA synthase